MALNWNNSHLEIIEAVLDGAARGFAFRAEELVKTCGEHERRLVPVVEQIKAYAKTQVGALAGCCGRCWTSSLCGACDAGDSLRQAQELYRKEISRYEWAISARRMARYDRTRLKTFRKLREKVPEDYKDNKKHQRAYASADNIIRYWAGWTKFHIKRF